jgi:triphosphoribosyl-dephospho-CoA synthetase
MVADDILVNRKWLDGLCAELDELQARLSDAEAVCDAEKHMREGITPQDRWEASREMDRVFKAYLAGKEKTDDRPRAEE